MLLKEKKALVTGGTSGIGRGIAKRFAEQGAHVIIVGTSPEKGKEVVEEMRSVGLSGAHFSFIAADVANFEAVQACAAEATKTLGGVDILVNCAGVTIDKLFLRMGEADWDGVIDVNLKSVFNFTSPIVKGMLKQRWGRVINIASVVGLTGNAGQVNYASSKMGMIGFTKSLAVEIASRNVTVNAIAPGFVRTKMTDAIPEESRKALLGQIPMGRMGEAEEIANAALFLASDWASYITGQTLVVDGGMIA